MAIIGIASHDAGGAELLSHWVGNSKDNSFLYCLAGPAEKIFEKNLGVTSHSKIHEMLDHCDWLLCSTSWQSDLEAGGIEAFKNKGKKTVAILDHWVNYRERFNFNNIYLPPDEIWVVDKYAKYIAEKCFDHIPINLVKNFYLAGMKKEITSIEPTADTAGVALYVCEPIREHAFSHYGDERYWGYTEEDALKYFLNNIGALPRNIEKIIIRPHPSESTDKYKWVIDRYKQNIEFGGEKSLAEEVASASVVIGCESMAMVVGLSVGKLTVSSIPPDGRRCVLPHTEILSLQNLVKGIV